MSMSNAYAVRAALVAAMAALSAADGAGCGAVAAAKPKSPREKAARAVADRSMG